MDKGEGDEEARTAGGLPGSDGASSAGERKEGRAGVVAEEKRKGPARPRLGEGLTQQQFSKSFDGALPAFPSRRCRLVCRLLA